MNVSIMARIQNVIAGIALIICDADTVLNEYDTSEVIKTSEFLKDFDDFDKWTDHLENTYQHSINAIETMANIDEILDEIRKVFSLDCKLYKQFDNLLDALETFDAGL